MNITFFGVVTSCMKCDQKFLDCLIEYTTSVLHLVQNSSAMWC